MSVRRYRFGGLVTASIIGFVVACGEPTSPAPADLELPDEIAARTKKGTPNSPPPDVQAPPPPGFTVVDLGPTHVKLSWSSTDASPPILYYLTKNGVNVFYGFETSSTFAALQPSTTYTFSGKARDMAGNWSEMSAPFTVTTTAPDANDKTPPTTPSGVWADLYGDGGREMQVLWSASTDNVTPKEALIYAVAVNGIEDNTAVGKTWTSVYGVAGENVITVVAIDGAGNRSAAGSFTIFIPF